MPTVIHGPLSDDDALALYKECDAVWFFDYRRGVPGAPHAVLTSGLHSDGYVDSQKVYSKTWISRILIAELVRRLYRRNSLLEHVDMVVSSSDSAIHFGYELARQLGTEARFVVKNTAFETDRTAPRFICKFQIPEGCNVLRAEELITTFETTGAVRTAVELANPHGRIRWNPDVACGVLRPDSDRATMAFGDIICLAEKIVKSWRPEDFQMNLFEWAKELNLPSRVINALLREKIETVADLIKVGQGKLMEMKGVGKKSIQLIEEELKKMGISLA